MIESSGTSELSWEEFSNVAFPEGIAPARRFGTMEETLFCCFERYTASFAGWALATEGLNTCARAPFAWREQAELNNLVLSLFESLRGDPEDFSAWD